MLACNVAKILNCLPHYVFEVDPPDVSVHDHVYETLCLNTIKNMYVHRI